MTNRQILEKALRKALDAGWEVSKYAPLKSFTIEGYRDNPDLWVMFYKGGIPLETAHVNDIIFRHDFAKSLWGDKGYVELREMGGGTFTHWLDKDFNPSPTQAWQFHLQQLVIADDVFKYLEEN